MVVGGGAGGDGGGSELTPYYSAMQNPLLWNLPV